MTSERTQRILPGFEPETNLPAVEREQATHVIAKGKVVYLPHDERGFTTRSSFYVRLESPAQKKGWGWYRTLAPVSLWHDGAHEMPANTLLQAGPRSAVKATP